MLVDDERLPRVRHRVISRGFHLFTRGRNVEGLLDARDRRRITGQADERRIELRRILLCDRRCVARGVDRDEDESHPIRRGAERAFRLGPFGEGERTEIGTMRESEKEHRDRAIRMRELERRSIRTRELNGRRRFRRIERDAVEFRAAARRDCDDGAAPDDDRAERRRR